MNYSLPVGNYLNNEIQNKISHENPHKINKRFSITGTFSIISNNILFIVFLSSSSQSITIFLSWIGLTNKKKYSSIISIN